MSALTIDQPAFVMTDTTSLDSLDTLDLKQAAKFLRAGYETTKELVENGDLPAVCLNQKHTVLLREDLIAYVREEGRRQAATRKAKKQAAQIPEAKRRRAGTVMPDLARYEITTSVPPAKSRAN